MSACSLRFFLPIFFVFCSPAFVLVPSPATAQTDETPVVGGTIVIHTLSGPETLNLITANDAVAQEIHSYIYETLTITDPITLETIPWIAEALPTLSSDYRTYEFRLRKDVFFSDGRPVTGNDFIFYLKAVKNNRIEEAAAVRSYYERVDSAMLIDGDPYRLRVVMREPYSFGAQWAGGLYAFPKHLWDPAGISDQISFAELNDPESGEELILNAFAATVEDRKKGFNPKYLVGSGPYIFEKYKRNDRLTLQRNPNYWNRENKLGRAYPERLVWREISTYDTALIALKEGTLDVMPRMEKRQWAENQEVFSRLGIQTTDYEYPAYSYLGYNLDVPIFSDPRVRNAFARAIDRNRIIEDVYFGYAIPIASPVLQRRPEYDTSLRMIEFNIDEGKRLLDEAGWTDSDGDGIRDKEIDGEQVNLEFAIMLNWGNMARRDMADIIIRGLKKMGVGATTETVEWSDFLARLDNHEFQAVIGGWVRSVQEDDMYQIWHSASAQYGGSNYCSFMDDEVDSLITAIREEFDYEKRKKMYKRIQQIIYREQPYNFLVSERQTAAYNKRLHGVNFFAPRPCYNAGWWWISESNRQ